MNAESYYYYKSKHICVNCGVNSAYKNYVCCLECRFKKRQSSLEYYHNHKNGEEFLVKHRNASKRRYNDLKEKGICTHCGKRQATENRTLCDWCAKRRNQRDRERYLIKIYATKEKEFIRI